jgi:hypothetical protein
MKTVYQYNHNGYYIGETTAYTMKQGDEEILPLPYNSTELAPELQDGYIPRWTGEAWEQIENHKGETGYLNGEHTEIKEYGALPEGWSTEAPEPSEEEKARTEAYNQLREADAGMQAIIKQAMPELLALLPTQATTRLRSVPLAEQYTSLLEQYEAAQKVIEKI